MPKTTKGLKSELKALRRTLAKEKRELLKAKRMQFEVGVLRNRIRQARTETQDVCEGRDDFPY